jgi:hypothetical protein
VHIQRTTFVLISTMGVEHYVKLCDKLRAKSIGVMAELDHSALLLDDNNILRFADALWQSPHQVTSLSLNVSLIGVSSRRKGGTGRDGGCTWLPHGLDRLVHFIRTNPTIIDVRLSGSESSQSCKPSIQNSVITHFIEAIENNPSIQRLSLYNVCVETELISRLVRRSKTIQHMSIVRCSFLKYCDIGRNVQSDENVPIVTQKMAASFALNKSITSLRLIGLDENLILSILEQLQSHSCLQKLDVSCNTSAITSAVGQLISGKKVTLPKINHLIVRDSSLQGWESIVRSITFGMSPIQRFDVVNCSIDAVSASLFRTLFRCTKHTIHHVSFCDILLDDDTNLEEMFQGLMCNQTITHLTLHRVTLQDRDYHALTHLLQNNKNLTNVNLDRKILATMERQQRKSTSNIQVRTESQNCSDFIFSRESGKLRPFSNGTMTTV